jgi:hypothetical protein
MTEDTSLYVIVVCEVWSRSLPIKESNNPVTSPTPSIVTPFSDQVTDPKHLSHSNEDAMGWITGEVEKFMSLPPFSIWLSFPVGNYTQRKLCTITGHFSSCLLPEVTLHNVRRVTQGRGRNILQNWKRNEVHTTVHRLISSRYQLIRWFKMT